MKFFSRRTAGLIIVYFVFNLFFNLGSSNVFAQNYLPSYHEPRPIKGADGWFVVGERFLELAKEKDEALEIIVRNLEGKELPIRVEVFKIIYIYYKGSKDTVHKDGEIDIAAATKNYDQTLATKIKLWEEGKASPRDLSPKDQVVDISWYDNSSLEKNLPGSDWAEVSGTALGQSILDSQQQNGRYNKYFNRSTNQALWILKTSNSIDNDFKQYYQLYHNVTYDTPSKDDKAWIDLQNKKKEELTDLGILFANYTTGKIQSNKPVSFYGGEVTFFAPNTVITGKLNLYGHHIDVSNTIIHEESSEKRIINIPTKKTDFSLAQWLKSFFVKQKVETQVENISESTQQKIERRFSTDITGQKVDAPRRDPIQGVSSDWKFINSGRFGPPKTNNDPDEGAPYWDIQYTGSGKLKTLRVLLDDKIKPEEKVKQAIQEDLELQKIQRTKK